jgi:hypothetical protein
MRIAQAEVGMGTAMRLLCGLVTAAFATLVVAQEAVAVDSAALLSKIRSDKRGLVSNAMQLTPDEAARFWPLYEKFQRELAAVNGRHTRAVLDYVAVDGKLSDANADRLARQVLQASLDEARMRQRQYTEVKKQIPASKAARYMQIENKIQAVLRFETAKAIPLAE